MAKNHISNDPAFPYNPILVEKFKTIGAHKCAISFYKDVTLTQFE